MTLKLDKSVQVVLVAAVLTTGCQSNPIQTDDPAGAQPASGQADSSDATRTRTEGAFMGALVGGLLGYAVGDKNRGKGALIGAAVGAGVGYIVGNEIAKRKQQYATEEDFLDSEIATAREFNQTATAYNTQLRDEIVNLDNSSRLVESRYRAGLASKSEVEAERQTLKTQIADSEKLYQDLKKEYDIKVAVANERRQQKGGGDEYVRQLDQEIASLKQNMDELQAQSVQLAQIDERLTI